MIDVKVIKGRFVTCFPMAQPNENDKRMLGWRQMPSDMKRSKRIINTISGLDGPSGIYDQIATKQDKQ